MQLFLIKNSWNQEAKKGEIKEWDGVLGKAAK